MNTKTAASGLLLAFTACAILPTSCNKEQEQAQDCRTAPGGGGIMVTKKKTVMFWTDRSMGLGKMTVMKIVNHETGVETGFNGTADIAAYYNSQPECEAAKMATIYLPKGYVYEYTITSDSGTVLQGTFDAGCSDDCLAVNINQ